MSPTARTLQECKRRGWLAQVVERWIPKTKIKVDVWGFGDVLALDDQRGSLLIQTTTTAHAANRVQKIRTECAEKAIRWIAAGNRIVVWGWALRGDAGKRKLWTLKEYPVEAV